MILLVKNIRRIIKRSPMLFSWHTRLTSKDYKAQKKRMPRSSVKSKAQIKREMKMYANYWHMPANEYIRYGLFEKQLTDDEILDYIPSQFFYCEYLRKSYQNLEKSQTFYDDKLNQFEILKQHGIPTPEILYVIKDAQLMTVDGENVETSALTSLLNEANRIFIKPTDGCGGSGIIVLNNGDQDSLDLNKLGIDKSRTYIVQKGLTQNQEISKIYDGCINTLRTIVQYRNEKVNIVGCILRMGRQGAKVDNSAQGGLSIKVNFEDGSFCPPAQAEHGGGAFAVHPDSGYDFYKNRIGGWDEIKKEIIENVGKLKDFGDVGWDIALTGSGISVIEFNLGYGIVHAQLSCGGLRRILNAYPK